MSRSDIELQDYDDLNELAAAGNHSDLAARIKDVHPATLADFMESLPRENRLEIWSAAPSRTRGETLLELHDEARDELISVAPHEMLTRAIIELEADEIADLDAHLPEAVYRSVLSEVDAERFRDFEAVRGYPDNCAGGLMDVDAIRVRPNISLAAAQRYLQRLRHRRGTMPEHFDSIMVVDQKQRLVGTLSLAELVSCNPRASVQEAMQPDPVSIEASVPADDVARLFEDRDLFSAPVVDEDRHVLGRITIDDVVDVIRESGDRLAMRPVGIDGAIDLFASVQRSVRRRLLWLAINMINAFLAAWVIGLFEASIQAVVALAVLMPVVASMGGAAGNQTLALIVRGLALEQVHRANFMALVRKESLVGLLNGMIFAAVVGGIAFAWFRDVNLAFVFALAMIANLFLGTFLGTALPMLLRMLGIDPALAGSVALAAMTDVFGFFLFLGLATLIIL